MELKATLAKPFKEDEKIDFIVEQNHNNGYEIRETETALEAWGNDDAELLELIKRQKISENDKKRDIALNSGIVYRNILFDSDTDQKVNLLATVSTMQDDEHIIWFGLNNNVLVATKEDLTNIGNLIVELHTLCWTENARVKGAIEAAETIEEVENIEINYEMEGE